MDTVDSLKYLQGDLKDRIAWQTKRHRWERAKSLIRKTLAVALAATITVLLGLEGDVVDATVAKNLALVFAAVIVLVNAWEAFFNHRGMWICTPRTGQSLMLLRPTLISISPVTSRERSPMPTPNGSPSGIGKSDRPR